jgi:hypothetical protein
MDLQPPFIVYSEGRPPFHDGMDEERARVSLVCPRCSHAVERNVLSCLSTGTEWFSALPPEDREAVAGVFGCSLERVGSNAIPYARFPNGRHAYLCTAQCPACQSQYVLAIDFYEKQPARYIGVLQGAAGLAPNNSSKPTPPLGAA